MKKKIIVVISVFCLSAFGCNSQRRREAFLEEYIKVSEKIVRIVDANPTAEGVKQAQSYLDSNKSSLKTKFEAAGNDAPDKDMQEKFRVIMLGQINNVRKLADKHPELKSQLDKLSGDFGGFLLKP